MGEHVAIEPQHDRMDKEVDIADNKLTNKSCYAGIMHYKVRRMIQEARVEQDEERLICPTDYR